MNKKRKRNIFKNITKSAEKNEMVIIRKKRGLTSEKIFKKPVVTNVNREKRCRIPRALLAIESATKTYQP